MCVRFAEEAGNPDRWATSAIFENVSLQGAEHVAGLEDDPQTDAPSRALDDAFVRAVCNDRVGRSERGQGRAGHSGSGRARRRRRLGLEAVVGVEPRIAVGPMLSPLRACEDAGLVLVLALATVKAFHRSDRWPEVKVRDRGHRVRRAVGFVGHRVRFFLHSDSTVAPDRNRYHARDR